MYTEQPISLGWYFIRVRCALVMAVPGDLKGLTVP